MVLVDGPLCIHFPSISVVDSKDLDIPLPQSDETEDLLRENALVQCAWYLHVDIYCLNYDGNMLDASLMAILAALKTGREREKKNALLLLNPFF